MVALNWWVRQRLIHTPADLNLQATNSLCKKKYKFQKNNCQPNK